VRHLISVDDLELSEFDAIVETAQRFRDDDLQPRSIPSRVTATLFGSSSLRTRAGFETAAHRLGWSVVSVGDYRYDPSMSAAESIEDTIRTLSGMVDSLVVRAPVDLGTVVATAQPTCPILCGGDLQNHPTQALIDIASIRALRGSERNLRIALYGDLTMRAAASLLAYFARQPPAELRLIAPRGREAVLTADLDVTYGGPDDVDDIDVLYVVGLPLERNGVALDTAARAPYVIAESQLRRLPAEAIILSPLPVVDELSNEARSDPRLRIWEQNELSISVRMASLVHTLA